MLRMHCSIFSRCVYYVTCIYVRLHVHWDPLPLWPCPSWDVGAFLSGLVCRKTMSADYMPGCVGLPPSFCWSISHFAWFRSSLFLPKSQLQKLHLIAQIPMHFGLFVLHLFIHLRDKVANPKPQTILKDWSISGNCIESIPHTSIHLLFLHPDDRYQIYSQILSEIRG